MTAVIAAGAVNLAQEQEAHARELRWLLDEISRDLESSVMVGLEESLARLLEPKSGMKLVISSTKSEALKGVVSRSGDVLNECDLTVRLGNHYRNHPARTRLKSDSKYALVQLSESADFMQEALMVGSHLRNSVSARQAASKLNDMLNLTRSALACLREPDQLQLFPQHTMDRNAFSALPDDVVIDLYIRESTIITDIRLLESKGNNAGALSGFASAFSMNRRKSEQGIAYSGTIVHERARITVQSQDPNLMAVSAKLDAVESHLGSICRKLDLCLAAQPPVS